MCWIAAAKWQHTALTWERCILDKRYEQKAVAHRHIHSDRDEHEIDFGKLNETAFDEPSISGSEIRKMKTLFST